MAAKKMPIVSQTHGQKLRSIPKSSTAETIRGTLLGVSRPLPPVNEDDLVPGTKSS
jgi:hypothetical protein